MGVLIDESGQSEEKLSGYPMKNHSTTLEYE